MKKLGVLFALLFIFGITFAQDSTFINRPKNKFRKEYVLDCGDEGRFHFFLHNRQFDGDYKTKSKDINQRGSFYYLYGFLYKEGKVPIAKIEIPISKKSFKSSLKRVDPSLFTSGSKRHPSVWFNRFYFGSFSPFKFVYSNGKVSILSHYDRKLIVDTYDITNRDISTNSYSVGYEFTVRQVESYQGKLFVRIQSEMKGLSQDINQDVLLIERDKEKLKILNAPNIDYQPSLFDYKSSIAINKEEKLIGRLVESDDEKTFLFVYDFSGEFISKLYFSNNEIYSYRGCEIIPFDKGFFIVGDYDDTSKKIDHGFFVAHFTKSSEEFLKRYNYNIFNFKTYTIKGDQYIVDSKEIDDVVIVDGVAYFAIELFNSEVTFSQSSSGMSRSTNYYYDREVAFVGFDIGKAKLTLKEVYDLKRKVTHNLYSKTDITYFEGHDAPLFTFEKNKDYLDFATVSNGEFRELKSPINYTKLPDLRSTKLLPGIPVTNVHSIEDNIIIIEFYDPAKPIESYYHKL
jgi:hypothetical protein